MEILIIEDQKKVAEALNEGLRHDGYSVTLAADGEEGFFLISTRPFDLVVLDLSLPKRDGMEILKTLRQKKFGVPVLILTARDSVDDRVMGLESGADDYMIKPFAFPELLARIHALLRRSKQEQVTRLSVADLEFDLLTRRVIRQGQLLSLTVREQELLEYLLRNKNAVVSREMLARDVWKATTRATPLDNVIDVHITHLRRKIDGPFDVKLLHTLRGVGFTLSSEKP